MIHYFKDSNTKPFAITILILLALLIGFSVYFICMGEPAKNNHHEYYALAAKIVEINSVEDVVTCEDCNGNLWEFTGIEDWNINDNANLLMDTCGTAEIYDDVICGVSYARWALTKS